MTFEVLVIPRYLFHLFYSVVSIGLSRHVGSSFGPIVYDGDAFHPDKEFLQMMCGL